MAQFNDLIVTGAARFVNQISGTIERAVLDGNGSNISNTYMQKARDYVTAGIKSGITVGSYSTAEGYQTTSSNTCTHAEGYSTTASGTYSHAEGYGTKALNNSAHAEGYYTTASGQYSHAEGYYTTASGDYSHAEGYHTTASGDYSHTDGCYTECTAAATFAHASGWFNTAGSPYQFVCGLYNAIDEDSKYAFIIGNGESASSRHNALTVTWAGMTMMGYTDGVVPSVLPHLSKINLNDLIAKVCMYNGCFGTVRLSSNVGNKLYSDCDYAYIYIPHRYGGFDGRQPSGGDNTKYGNLLMFPIINNGTRYACVVRYANGSVASPVNFYYM